MIRLSKFCIFLFIHSRVCVAVVLNDAQRIAKNKLKDYNRRKRAAKEMEEGAERIENLLTSEHHTLVRYATAALVHMRNSMVSPAVALLHVVCSCTSSSTPCVLRAPINTLRLKRGH